MDALVPLIMVPIGIVVLAIKEIIKHRERKRIERILSKTKWLDDYRPNNTSDDIGWPCYKAKFHKRRQTYISRWDNFDKW